MIERLDHKVKSFVNKNYIFVKSVQFPDLAKLLDNEAQKTCCIQQNSGVRSQESEVKIALALTLKLKRCTSLTCKLL